MGGWPTLENKLVKQKSVVVVVVVVVAVAVAVAVAAAAAAAVAVAAAAAGQQSRRVHYFIGTMDTASTNGVPIMCPILRLSPTFEPKLSTHRHFSSLRRLV